MPEGPEVKLSAEAIKPMIQNQIIIDACPSTTGRYGNGNAPEGYRDFTKSFKHGDCRVLDIRVKGKLMYWTFSNGQADKWYMLNTFGMTGQWSEVKGKHPCFTFQYATSIDRMQEYKQLTFNDPRHFGTIKFINNQQVMQDKLDSLGWDPLNDPQADRKWLDYKLSSSNKTIAQLLMDQSLFCGVGNYVKCESLYASKISPWRKACTLTQVEIQSLYSAIVDVMQTSYANNGATISTYATVQGEKGEYSDFFKVYGKKLDPEGNPIVAETTPDKRTTHWVPSIQK